MKDEEKAVIDSDRESESHIVHTRNITDGESRRTSTYWRDRVDEIGFDNYAHELFDEVGRTWITRKQQLLERWPTATFEGPQFEAPMRDDSTSF